MSVPTTEAVATPTQLPMGLLVLVGALAAMGPFSIDLYLPAFGAIADDLGVGPDRVQVTLSSYFVGLALGQLVVGPLSDRVGRRGPLMVGLVLYTLASLLCAASVSVGWLAVARTAQALGACAALVASRAVLRDRFEPRDMARALSMVMLVMGLAPILAPLVGAAMHEALGWRALFFALSAYGAAVAVAVGFGLEESLAHPVKAPLSAVARGAGEVLRTRAFTAYALAGSLAQASMFAYIGSSSFVFTEVFGLSSTGFAMLFGTNACGLIAASQVNERWLRRRSPEAILPIVMGVQSAATVAVLGVVLTGFGGVVGLAVPLFVAVATLGFTFPNTTAAALAPMGGRAGLASAVLGTMQYGIAGLATFVAAQLHDGTALPMAVAMAGFSVAASGVLALGAPRTAVA